MRENIRLKVIPEPRTRDVMIAKNRSPVFKGTKGEINYLCGFCDTILARNVMKGEIKDKVVKCRECLRFNEFR